MDGLDSVESRLADLKHSMDAAWMDGDRPGWLAAWKQSVELKLIRLLQEWAAEDVGAEDWGPAETWPVGAWDLDRWNLTASEESGRWA